MTPPAHHPGADQPRLPQIQPDPFARAAWHMKNAHAAGMPFCQFWDRLGDFIADQGRDLAEAGGRWSMTDSPPACRAADELAQLYLAALNPAALATIPPGLHS